MSRPLELELQEIETACTAIEAALPDAYLVTAGDEARLKGFAIAELLRSRVPGLKLSMDCGPGGLKAQLKRADRSGARLALIVGEDELRAAAVAVKPLRSEAPQKTLKLDELVADLVRDVGPSA